MADTIAVMNEGRIEQAGSAADLYERPRTEFVANFLGVSNLVDAKLSSTAGDVGTVETHDGARLTLPARPDRRRTAPTPSASACAPRRSRSCPPARTARAAPTSCAAPSIVAALPRRLDPVRDPRRGRRGADRHRAERRAARSPSHSASGREVQLAWQPQHTFVVAKETTHAD